MIGHLPDNSQRWLRWARKSTLSSHCYYRAVTLTGGDGQGTTVHFEKALDWVPGAAGQHLFSADTAS